MRLRFLRAALLLFAAPVALAYQQARVPMEGTPVLDKPDPAASVVRNIEGGKDYWVSSRKVRSADGAAWYRILIDEQGVYGFVSAAHVITADQAHEVRTLGIDDDSPATHVVEPDTVWTVHGRGLGLGAGSLQSGELSLLPGGEAEMGMSLGLKSRGQERHRYGVAAAAAFFDGALALTAAFVLRPFAETRIEPELRIRAGILSGDSFPTSFAAGMSLGARYPLSIRPGPHLSLCLEGTGLVGVDSAAPILFWLGGGISFHL